MTAFLAGLTFGVVVVGLMAAAGWLTWQCLELADAVVRRLAG